MDDHVDFIRAVFHCVARLKGLCGGGGIAVREADDGADGHASGAVVVRKAHIGRRDADAGRPVMHGVVAERTNVLTRGVHSQQRVIYMGEYFLQFHKTTSFVFDGFSIPQKRARYQSPGASSSGVYSKISPG